MYVCTCRQYCETVATRIKQSLPNTSDHLTYCFDAHYQTVTAKTDDDFQLTLRVLNANYVDYNFKTYVVQTNVMTLQELNLPWVKYWRQSNGTSKRSDYLRCSIYVALFRKHFTQAIRKQCGNCTRYLQYQRFDVGVRSGLYKRNIEEKYRQQRWHFLDHLQDIRYKTVKQIN
jgi:hypothetical protein